MLKVIFISILITFVLGGCSTSEKQIVDALRKNPQIVFNVIEENPEQFIEVVNKAARKAQVSQQQKQLVESQRQQEEQIKAPLRPVLSDKRLLFGSKSAKIIIVEYADFQCPACRMAYSSLKQIKEKYKDDVQVYYKNMPLDFHKMAYPAALYYEAVFKQSPVKAQKYYSQLFENQGKLQSEQFLKDSAKIVGADLKRIAADVQSQELKDIVTSDMNEFEKFGFTGTPVIIVNGVALAGAQPVSEIERVIALTQKN